MCGIAGIFASSKVSVRADATIASVKAMTLTIAHRGPDGHGLWADDRGRCFLGHRRLSIIDTSDAGLQPMADFDGRWVISFNGEIYNYQELKPELEAAGAQFKGRTDTEVLLAAIAKWGVKALPQLDGMFAFAAFDRVTGKMLIARDAFGEKPLYYTTLANGAVAFASELQALEILPGFDTTASLDAMAEVLTFQYVGAPRSIYQAVHKLEPGCWMEFDADGSVSGGRYYDFEPKGEPVGSRSMADLADELEDILVRSLQRRLISDVPLGAFLSGGVDSSVVCALVRRRLKLPLKTFSAGFSNAPESEHITARAFAEHLRTEHFENLISPDVSDFLENIGDLLDEPNGDSSCLPTYLLSKFVREHVTVAVSGDGGDEMFGGYGRYFATLEDASKSRADGQSANFRPGGIYYGGRILVGQEAFIQNLFGFIPPSFAEHLAQVRQDLDDSYPAHLLEGMRRTDVHNYLPGAVLPKVDRMSMRNSLEVRTPFLNTELARFAQSLPESVLVQNGRGKLVLRELAYRYLPRDLIDLPKQGFGLPMSDWARTSLLSAAQKLLLGDGGRLVEAFGWANINRYYQSQTQNFSAYQLWGVVMLENWLRKHPATLPGTNESAVRKAPRPVLDAVGVLPSLFLVAEGLDIPRSKPALNPAFAHLDWRVARLLTAKARENRVPDGASGAVVMRLPFWGEAVRPEDSEALSHLKGASLVFSEPTAMARFDYAEYNKLLNAGVRRVVFVNPYSDQELIELEFQRPGRMKRLISAARLFRHRVAGVAVSSTMRRLFGLKELHDDGYVRTAQFATIDGPPDTDRTTGFALFEGHLQMLPLPTLLDDLAHQTGRYSVWNRCLNFAPIVRRRLTRSPYWLVPINAATNPHLPIRVTIHGPTTTSETIEDEPFDAGGAEEAERLDEAQLEASRTHRQDQNADRVLAKLPPTAEAVDLRPGDRVVVYTHGLPPGGAERQWLYLAQTLKEAGYDVVFVTSHSVRGDNGHYLPDLMQSGIPHVDAALVRLHERFAVDVKYPLLQDLAENWLGLSREHLMLSLAFVLDNLKPKVVYAQLDEPNCLAGLTCVALGVPRVVLSFRNYNPTNFPYLHVPFLLPSYRLLARMPNVIFSGNFVGANEDYAQWIGIDPARVAHVPNVIEPARFPRATSKQVAALRSDLGLRTQDKLILGVFRLSPEKDPLLFVDVCTRLCSERDDLVCAIAGIGAMEAEVRERVEQAGLQGRIKVLGARRDVNVLMSSATLLLQTPEHEGMPNAVMEAQLLGLPVVSTQAGGTADVVLDGETGLLAQVGDLEGLVQHCRTLLDSPAKAVAMGAAGRGRALTEFKKEQLARRYLRAVDPGAVFLDDPQAAAVTEPDASNQRLTIPSAE